MRISNETIEYRGLAHQNDIFIEMEAMFTCLFEGETSSRAEIYYNNSQEKYSSFPRLIFILNLSTQKNNLEEDISRSGNFY
jgi:hypothetical protein